MEKIVFYALIAVSVISSIASVLTLNFYLIILSVSATVSLFFLYQLWDILEAVVIKKTGIVQTVGDYELEADRFSAIRKKGLHFSAISAAVLREFPSKEISRESMERIISSSNSPFRFVVQVEKLNTGKITDDLKTKRRMKELELSRAKGKKVGDSAKVVEREIELIESEIKSLGSGAVPLRTSIYLMSVGSSESRFAAQETALSQIREIAGAFSAVLGAGFEVISGADLISIIKSDLLD